MYYLILDDFSHKLSLKRTPVAAPNSIFGNIRRRLAQSRYADFSSPRK
jgi:hypothetical protein